MSQEELNKVAKLTRREREVLELVCEGNPYDDIAKKLFMSEPNVRATMQRVYFRLELDNMTQAARIAAIHQIYSPLLKSIIQTSKSPKTSSTYASEPQQVEKPKPVVARQADIPFDQQPAQKEPPTQPRGSQSKITPQEEPKQDDIPAPLVKSISKMVDEDEYFLVRYKEPPVIIVPARSPIKHPPTCWERIKRMGVGLVIGSGLCICVAAVLVLLYWNQNRAQFAASPNQPDSQPTQPPAQVINPTEPPQVIVVTATSLPGANPAVPAPTSAPAVVPTAVPAPVISLPFSDNFASGPSQQWKVLSGNWITANGRYTITPADGWAFVALDDPTWKNYKVHANIMVPHLGAGSQGQVGIFVRINKSPYLGFVENSITRVSWGILKPSDLYLSDIAGNQRVSIDKTFNLDLEVNGDNYIARLNGQEIQRISMSGYDSGGIALGIMCNISSPCESFSDVRVDPLP